MNRLRTFAVLGLGFTAGAAGHYVYVPPPLEVISLLSAWHGTAPAVERKVLYYRDPSGAPYWSATPKRDGTGRDYLPVYDEEEPSFDPSPQKQSESEASTNGRKVLYYRNPMGAPETSPVPKKDPMGMDYIPVYADEAADPGSIKVSLDKIQRIGVRTEKVELRPIVQAVRTVGRVEHDEALLTIVALRTDGFIENLFVNQTGQHVKEGEPLFRLYSSQIQLAQSDLIVAMRAQGRMSGADPDKNLEGASRHF